MRAVTSFILKALPGILLLTAGCKSHCRQLSEELCNCIATTIDMDTCLANAANQESRYYPTKEQDAYCATLLPKCNCFTTNTVEGKKACGLALP